MKQSAGILAYRIAGHQLEVFLVHPGGPFWKNKDIGSWSVPKGEFTDDENPLQAALREFEEETGFLLKGDFTPLKPVRLKSGKKVYTWMSPQDLDANTIKSNTFMIQWPPKSGRMLEVPEVDRAAWFPVDVAIEKINPAQAAFIEELVQKLNGDSNLPSHLSER